MNLTINLIGMIRDGTLTKFSQGLLAGHAIGSEDPNTKLERDAVDAVSQELLVGNRYPLADMNKRQWT